MPAENTIVNTTTVMMVRRPPGRSTFDSGYAISAVRASWTSVPTRVTTTVVTKARTNADDDRIEA